MKRTILTCIGVITLFSMIIGCSNEELANNSNAVNKQETNAIVEEAGIANSVESNTSTEVIPSEDTWTGITMKEADGLILFEYALHSALEQLRREETSDRIEIIQNAETTNYIFKDHIVLACGTHMEGEVIGEKLDGQIVYKGSFDVSVNPYGITYLEIDAIKDDKGTYSGTMVVDEKVLDISLLQI